LVLAACATDPAPIVPDEPGRGSEQCDPAAYPCGPYGFTTGEVIENLSFPVPNPDRVAHLSDLRTGKAIALFGCAMWCGPCQMEQAALVPAASKYGGDVVFFEALAQDGTFQPADLDDATRWATQNHLPFAVGADPTETLGPYFPQPAFPMQMVVRASDMTIVWQDVGADPVALQAQLDAVVQ
jgi:thiol-disulfide isomerase/thioredoxin